MGAKKAEAAAALVAELSQPVMRPTAGSAAVAAAIGFDPAAPAGIVADYLQDQGRDREAANIRAGKTAQQDPHEICLTGKGRYKGREYYAGAVTKDGTRVRLLTLPDAAGKYLDFWADCSAVEQTKRYEPRQVWDGRHYSNRTVTQYTTLGWIADFVTRQRRAEAAGEPACAACGKRGELHHDLEDGMQKCFGCCDMPE